MLFAAVFLFISDGNAQSKKPTKGKQTATKKTQTAAKDAKKDSRAKKETASAKSKSDAKSKSKQTESARKDAKNAKDSRSKKEAASAKDKNAKDKNAKSSRLSRAEQQKLTAAKKAEEARRRAAEEARRQAILAEQRRREQLAREARARKLAFERGLRTETVENIAKDRTEGEDLEIRRAAVAALGNHAGTVVVMEAQTGRILTIVNQDWGIRDSFKPCSTIKLVTGVAGLNEGIIDPDGGISSFRMNLDDALAYSNNVYFQKVGVNMGNDKVISYARALGLGEKTGINAENESSGKLPYNNSNARIYSHGDDFEVSPLQLAVMVSAISNGGRIVVPQIPRTRIEQANFRGYLRRQVNLPMNKVRGVIPGMVGAAEYGTARRGVDSTLGIAGKTGSCITKNSWIGLFASVAPIQNPKYSVVVITRGQAERGKYAAAVAGKVYQALAPRLVENGQKNLALIPVELKPKTQIAAKTPVKIEEEEDDEETAETETDVADASNVSEKTDKTEKIVSAAKTPAAKPVQKPLVQKTGSSKPVFKPVVIEVKKRKPEAAPSRPRIVGNN